MTLDDLVVVLADPFAWGPGHIYGFTHLGHILVEFDDGTIAQFDPHELELHAAWQAGNGQTLTDTDLEQLRTSRSTP